MLLGDKQPLEGGGELPAEALPGGTVRKTIDGIIATAWIEANLPLLFSDHDFMPYVEHLGLEAA